MTKNPNGSSPKSGAAFVEICFHYNRHSGSCSDDANWQTEAKHDQYPVHDGHYKLLINTTHTLTPRLQHLFVIQKYTDPHRVWRC